jgi:hypothetical protein
VENKVTIVNDKKPRIILMRDMAPGEFGIIVGGSYEGKLVQRIGYSARGAFVIGDKSSYWTRLEENTLRVRLLEPGTKIEITVGDN